jgi:hypothetical protein
MSGVYFNPFDGKLIALPQKVGSTDSPTFTDLSVTGNFSYGSTGTLRAFNITTDSTNTTVLSSFPIASFKTGKFLVQAVLGADTHVSEVLVTHNGTSAFSTEYAIVYTVGELFSLSVDIDAGNLRILVTPMTESEMTFRITETLLS